jgi:L-fuculose-phosphate aldolase
MATATQTIREQVASACRLIAHEGYADLTLGHVSARDPVDGAVYIKRRGVALDEVDADDVVALELGGPDMHLEAVLHAAVYDARPDVGAVVHGHPPFATALSACDATVELLTHDAVLFVDGVGVFDGAPELITRLDQGAAVAEALGHRRAVVLRNHGIVVVGKTVPWAVLTALTLERALCMQARARSLGALRPFARELAERLYPQKYNDGLVDEYWAAWLRKLGPAA